VGELVAGRAVRPSSYIFDQWLIITALALSFFRFLHQSGGSITIDSLDIKTLSLTALRSRLTILPQGSFQDLADHAVH
jgi:hypothetical protein